MIKLWSMLVLLVLLPVAVVIRSSIDSDFVQRSCCFPGRNLQVFSFLGFEK